MIRLSPEAVTDVMISCYNHFDHKVGIAFSTQKRMYDFAMSMQQQYREGLVPSTFYKQGIDEIFFDTGSSIRMFNGTIPANVYGRDFDTVVIDPDITDEDIIQHLESCERRRYNLRFKNTEYMEVDPAPLDEFLSGFSITKT